MSHWMDNVGIHKDLQSSLEFLEKDVVAVGERLVSCLKEGNKVFACGNGGSAAEAAHFVTELVGRFKKDRKPLQAFCLNNDGSTLTCILNDCGGEFIFQRQVAALGDEGDILVVFTTSGKSRDLTLAVEEARKRGVTTVGLIGKDGGELKGKLDYEIHVPHNSTDRIQEVHLLIIHTLCDMVDDTYALW